MKDVTDNSKGTWDTLNKSVNTIISNKSASTVFSSHFIDNRKVRDMNEAAEVFCFVLFCFNKLIVSMDPKLSEEIIQPVEGSEVQFYESGNRVTIFLRVDH